MSKARMTKTAEIRLLNTVLKTKSGLNEGN